MSALPHHLSISKQLGETPLEAAERLRAVQGIPPNIPLAYAGRLDPMATGQLLILVGDECKVQERYHTLDKEYQFEVLLGIYSDTHDVLGITRTATPTYPSKADIQKVLKELTGTITLPYPHFSSKTVHGKPLHTWTLEGRLDEIDIPTKTSAIYSLTLCDVRTITTPELVRCVKEKIASIPEVTDPRKALGADFRRTDVLASWETILKEKSDDTYTVLSLTCIASSGTYMRTLASVIGEKLGTKALAFSIHRSRIGKYIGIPGYGGVWLKTYVKD